MLDGARRVRIGFEQTLGLRPEIIPLHQFDEIEGSGNGQPAQTVLAFEDGNPGLQLVFQKDILVIGAEHFVNGRVQHPGQAVNR